MQHPIAQEYTRQWLFLADQYYLLARAAFLLGLVPAAWIIGNTAIEYFLKALLFNHDLELCPAGSSGAQLPVPEVYKRFYRKYRRMHDTTKLWERVKESIPSPIPEGIDKAIRHFNGFYMSWRYPDNLLRQDGPTHGSTDDIHDLDSVVSNLRAKVMVDPYLLAELPLGIATRSTPPSSSTDWVKWRPLFLEQNRTA